MLERKGSESAAVRHTHESRTVMCGVALQCFHVQGTRAGGNRGGRLAVWHHVRRAAGVPGRHGGQERSGGLDASHDGASEWMAMGVLCGWLMALCTYVSLTASFYPFPALPAFNHRTWIHT